MNLKLLENLKRHKFILRIGLIVVAITLVISIVSTMIILSETSQVQSSFKKITSNNKCTHEESIVSGHTYLNGTLGTLTRITSIFPVTITSDNASRVSNSTEIFIGCK